MIILIINSFLPPVHQCLNYTVGLVAGTICHPLCRSGEIRFHQCLGHGVKLHVLEAKWQGKSVVLKTPKTLGTEVAVKMAAALVPHDIKVEDFKITAKELANHVSMPECGHPEIRTSCIIMALSQCGTFSPLKSAHFSN